MITKANQSIRQKARAAGIPWWRVGQALGVSELTVIRWLRTPLPPEKEKSFQAVIERLIAAEGNGTNGE